MSSIYDQHLERNDANYAPLSPLSFIERASEIYPDYLALIHGDLRRTWSQTYARCRQFASRLQQAGIGKNDTVAVLLPNTPPMYEAHFGVPMAGAVLNAINTRLDAATIAFILDHGEAKALIVDAELTAVAAKALSLRQSSTPLLVIQAEDALYGPASAQLGQDYEQFIAEGDPDFNWQLPDDEWDAIALNYTSGTTGNPKGVVYHHRGAATAAVSNILEWDMPKHPVYLWTLPMFHCNGWCFPWAIAARAGVNVCLRRVEAAAIFEAMRQHRVSHYCGAPIVHNMLVNAAEELKQNLPKGIRAMVAGAAPPATMIEGMERMGFDLTHVYGLTEVYGPATVCTQHSAWQNLAIGERARLNARQGVRYHLQRDARVLDPETLEPVPWDGKTMGEIMFRGNITMKGYLKNLQATEQAFSGGWFHSGDLAVQYPDGYIQIRDRSKDIIISGGENISSIEVEDALYRHPDVMIAAVVAKHDLKWGEIPCAFIELKPESKATAEDIITHCKQHLASYKVPREVFFTELPKTSTGKIQKFALRKQVISPRILPLDTIPKDFMFKASQLLQEECLYRLAQQKAADFFPQVRGNYAVDEAAYLEELIALASPGDLGLQATTRSARALIEQVRRRDNAVDTLDALLRQYSLDTQEGLMLMCLAEALLRVPDTATADALIRDRLSAADWENHLGKSDNVLVNFAAWGLVMTGKVVDPQTGDGRPKTVLGKLIKRSGEPVIRAAMNQAMKLMGKQFVLGRTISEALKNGRPQRERGYSYSFDMLGEAALTAADAAKYQADYRKAIAAVGAEQQVGSGPRPSISIKLSALHPRYEVAQQSRVLSELFVSVKQLAVLARQLNVGISIDAEEADRLELSLLLFEKLLRDPDIAGWGELGLVVQAYSKRCLPVLVWLTLLGRELGEKMPLRLVKGAYWDSEIKQCQVQGLAGYPVFTRKEGTDVSYLACARFLLSDFTQGVIYPQFASHNAHSVSCILGMAGERDFEFQRLHGMGDALYDTILEQHGKKVRIYAPVGAHKDLLPYLVRRLLENGANSSFVHQLVDPSVPVETLIHHPIEQLQQHATWFNNRIPLPAEIFGRVRKNSAGINMNIQSQWAQLSSAYQPHLLRTWQGTPVINGQPLHEGALHEVRCPYDKSRVVGEVWYASAEQVTQAMDALAAYWPTWNATPVDNRARILEKIADCLEEHRPELMALCTLEAGKTLQDGIDEVREAVDFCRYYAQQARLKLGREELPGPTGERNELFHEGRGIFACISPWNFPLAIFLGQISAALVAGNVVLMKPAEQTSLIAARTLELMFEAGLPKEAVAFLPGDGATLGNIFCRDARLAGVCFTGSTEVARIINRQLAEKDGAIAALIAETGGQNAMLVDSTALPEQVIKDVIASAFTSAGQRCSALRVLYVQEDIAEKIIELLKGAMEEIKIGQSHLRETDVGPVIDSEAKEGLLMHIQRLQEQGKLIAETPMPSGLNGHFVAPVAFEIGAISELSKEQFGPILHLVRYKAADLGKVIDDINATGYGLTLGVHSRNEETAAFIESRARVGNLYVNRNQVGAVVGVQPFGGCGLSGTGPKAGGPAYLLRFVTERTTSTNTTAVGGNASLLSLSDEH